MLIVLILSVFFFAAGGKDVVKLLQVRDLYELDSSELEEGMYVRGDINYIVGIYAYTESTKNGSSKVTEEEFIIPVGSDQERAAGLALRGDKIQDGEAIFEEPAEASWTMPVQGTVQRMDAQSEQFYYETIGQDGSDPQIRNVFLPLIIKDGYLGSSTAGTVYLMAALGLTCAGYFLFLLIRVLSGGCQKSISAYCAAQISPELAMEEVEDFYRNTKTLHQVKMNSKFLLTMDSAVTVLIPGEELAWAYGNVTQHRTNGIPTGKTHAVVLCPKNGKPYVCAQKSEEDGKALMAALQEAYPEILLGYDAKLQKMYEKQRDQFLEFCRQVNEQRRTKRQEEATAERAQEPVQQETEPDAP